MSELLRRYSDELATGIFPDLPHRRSPFWRDAQNVVFTDISTQPIPGQLALFAPSDASPVLGLLAANAMGEDFIAFGTAEKLFRWDATDGLTEQGTGYDASLDEPWTIVSWGNHVLAGQKEDGLQVDTGSGYAAVPGAPLASIYVRRSPFLLAFNLSTGEKDFAWCDRDDYTDWVPTPTNFAGSLPIRDLDSPIVAAVPFGTEVFAASESRLFMISFIGAPLVFNSDLLLESVGAIGRRAMCAADGLLYGMGSRGIWRTDGNREEYLETSRVRKYIRDNLNFSRRGRVVAWHDKFLRQVVFFFPGIGSDLPNMGVAFNYQDNNWSRIGFGRTAASNEDIFESGLTGTAQGNVLVQNLPGAPQGSLDIGVLDLNVGAELALGFGFGGVGVFPVGGRLSVEG